ncbi:MAG: alginate export family protein [Nitrospirae bacterium]|nr:alginate export family protein [Nitrospirota bacterium]MBI3378457.1 alginate export family protein [Nitrospirota bacterium]
MKKYLALVLGVLFTLGFAVSAFAITAEIPAETQAAVAKGSTQITLGGEIRLRGELTNNTDLDQNSGVKENADTKSYYDGRVRLRIQAEVSKNTMGVIHLETGDSSGSATNASDNYVWASQTGEGVGTYTSGNAKKGSMEVLEAWIQHKFNVGVPAGIKVGHMPLKLGDGLFFDHSKFGDDAIMVFMDPTKELNIALLTAKFTEGTNIMHDDADAYMALATYTSGKTSVGADFTYLDDSRNYISSAGALTAQGPNNGGLHLYNLGLRAATEVVGFGIKGDVEFNGGRSRSEANFTGLSDKEIKNRGYAYLVGVSYKLNPVKLSLDYAFGSGDNNSADNKNNGFANALSNVQKYTYVYDYRVKTAQGSTNTGLTNTRYIKLGATGDLTKELNIDANFYLLSAAKKKSITVGTTTSTTTDLGSTASTVGDSKKIGRELDAKITYKLDKNLVYFVEGGYLWTGAFYDTASQSADDAYAVRHGLTLSF